MDPVMLRIGDFEIKWYSILILLGVIFAYYLLEKESKKYNYPKDFIFNLFFLGNHCRVYRSTTLLCSVQLDPISK